MNQDLAPKMISQKDKKIIIPLSSNEHVRYGKNYLSFFDSKFDIKERDFKTLNRIHIDTKLIEIYARKL